MNRSMRLTRIALIALLITLIIARSGSQVYAFMSSPAYLTTKDEKELGKEFMLFVKKRLTLIEEPFIVNYVNKVGKRIVAQIPSPLFDFHFYVVKEDTYNAFAAPAGHVFINSGLLAAMDSEEELAGILAHEVAHVLCRHISKQIEKSKKIGLVTLAGILTGIFLGGSGEAAGAITSASIAAGQSLSLKYSREHEIQADQVGLKYLTKAGYGGEGLLRVLNKIREKRWFGPEQIPTYLTTHPAVEARMAYLDTWIQAHPEWSGSARSTDSTELHKVRNRLIALYGDTTIAHITFDAGLRKDPEDGLAYYGKGLVFRREGKKEEALKHLKKAIRLRPQDADILRELAQTYFHMGDYGNALKAVRQALALSPKDLEGSFLLARAQMEMGNLQGALNSFKTLVDTAPDYLPAIYYLGETYGKLGNLGEAHYHLGIYYREKGQLRNAKFHLKRALNFLGKDTRKRLTIEKVLKEISGAQGHDRIEKNAS
ncbi:MAG: M48 family metalloprotease [Desulfobacterales bacterium]|nr:M48 family metalloprotease [Desulfobacterales bacterium]